MADLTRLQSVFREVLDEPGLRLAGDARMEDIEGWDSVAHVGLLAAVEEEYGFEFGLDETLTLDSVGAILEAITRRQGQG